MCSIHPFLIVTCLSYIYSLLPVYKPIRVFCNSSVYSLYSNIQTSHHPLESSGLDLGILNGIRLLLALVCSAIYNWKLRQFDIKCAYLHGELNEEIYMMQAPGYEDNTNKVYHLFRPLYGLKHAGNIWNAKLNDTLTTLGFNQLKSNYCCYVQRSEEGCTILLILVDNFLSISDQDELNNWIETKVNKHFEVKSLGQPSIILKVHQENHLIEISQTHYIDTLLKKYGLQDANPVSTPMDLNI